MLLLNKIFEELKYYKFLAALWEKKRLSYLFIGSKEWLIPLSLALTFCRMFWSVEMSLVLCVTVLFFKHCVTIWTSSSACCLTISKTNEKIFIISYLKYYQKLHVQKKRKTYFLRLLLFHWKSQILN